MYGSRETVKSVTDVMSTRKNASQHDYSISENAQFVQKCISRIFRMRHKLRVVGRS
jgi:uncharacterized membrane protein